MSELALSLGDPCSGEDDLLSVTFDDGYENFLTDAYPLLRALGIPATLFVVTGLVGSESTWNRQLGLPTVRLLDWCELARIDRTLVEIGSHGVSHRSFSRLTLEEIDNEISVSRDSIEKHLGGSVRAFCYPYGSRRDLHPAAANLLAVHGFQTACSSKWGRFNTERDRFALKRIVIWHHDTFDDFRRKLEGCFDWLEIKEAVGFRLRPSPRKL